MRSSLAAAQSSDRLALQWDAPSSCPKASEVSARTQALAGAQASSRRQLRAAGTVEQRRDGRFHLRLVVTLDGLVGERTLEAGSCEDLAGAAAVHLALMLRNAEQNTLGSTASGASTNANTARTPAPEVPAPGSAEREPGGSGQAQSSGSAERQAPGSAQLQELGGEHAQQPSSADERSRVRWLVQLPRASFGLGPMPAPSFGVFVAGGVELDAWSAALSGTFWWPHVLPTARPDSTVEANRVDASLRVCRTLPLGRFALMPCLGLSLQQLWARGVGPNIRAKRASQAWFAGGVGLAARWRVASWFNVLGSADLKVQTARPRLSIDGLGRVAELGVVAVELSIGPEWIL